MIIMLTPPNMALSSISISITISITITIPVMIMMLTPPNMALSSMVSAVPELEISSTPWWLSRSPDT